MSEAGSIVAIVGAGEMGRATLEILVRRLPEVVFRVVDRDQGNLDKAAAVDPDRVRVLTADYNTDAIDLRDVALVANFAGPFYSGSDVLARLAITNGCHYFDICDDVEGIRPILALADTARDAGVALVTGGGNSPGTSNLMAKRLLELDDEVDGIRIVWVADDAEPGGLAPLRHMLHMTIAPCPVWQNGEFVNERGFVPSTARTYEMPELGTVEAYNTAHSETITLAYAFPHLRHISVQGALHPAWASEAFSTLGRIGFGYSDLKVDVDGRQVDPVEVLWKVLWARHTRRPSSRDGLSAMLVQALKGDTVSATMSLADPYSMVRTTGISAAAQIMTMLAAPPDSGASGTEALPAQATLDLVEDLAREMGAIPKGIVLDATPAHSTV
jgi:lysine 6-dehydrogenase